LSAVRPNGSPLIALVTGCGLAAIMAASGSYEDLITFNVALGFVINSAVCLAAWRLRSTEPAMPRPWRMPLHPFSIVFAVLVNLGLLAAMIAEDPFHSLAGIGAAVLIGVGSSLMTAGPRRQAA